jgi:alpha-beta hydrolase superfamily lysophospholipase
LVVPDQPIIYLSPKAPDENFPKDWGFIEYAPTGNTNIVCYRAYSRGDPIAKIILFSGFKSDMETYDNLRIRAFQRMGIEIDIILLPDPDKQLGYLQDNKEIVYQSLINQPPPGCLIPSIPHFVFAHSLSGRAFLENMLDEDFAHNITRNYTGAVLIAPHFSSPFRSNLLLDILYSNYCKIYSDRTYGEAPLDGLFSAADAFKRLTKANDKRNGHSTRFQTNKETITSDNTTTTHGQILHSNREGEKTWKFITEKGVSELAKAFPMIMLGGSKDFVSSSKYIEKIAEVFAAPFHKFRTCHQPFLESREARALVLRFIRETMSNKAPLVTPTRELLTQQNLANGFPVEHGLEAA